MQTPLDSFGCRRALPGSEGVDFMSLPAAQAAGAGPIDRLPYSLRILADCLLRREDGRTVTRDQVLALTGSLEGAGADTPIAFYPGRILMQDSSGIPVMGDLAALEEAIGAEGPAPERAITLPVDLVVDHGVEVDHWAGPTAQALNLAREFERNDNRYRFLRWADQRLPWLRVVPPGVGICHQLNLEVLSDVVTTTADGLGSLAGCDTLLGTDSHTTMINGLSVLGWGVGGIEALSALLGHPVSMATPQVVGVRLQGALRPGITATDLALSLTAELRQQDLVQRIAEFFGPGVASLTIPDRATIANMAPEYGATMGFFPADEATLAYLALMGRPAATTDLAGAFLRAQGLLRTAAAPEPAYGKVIDFDLSAVEPTVAGPRRPQDRKTLSETSRSAPPALGGEGLDHGHVVIAAISSCTNTSNPRLLAAAGLLAQNAVARGLSSAPWVKTSLAPGSRIASQMLRDTGLQAALDTLGFNLIGHGCTTCMGNSGPLPAAIAEEITARELAVAAIVSGNRNFEGRLHPLCSLGYLASPPLIVAYALAGTVQTDLTQSPLGCAADGQPVFLKDIWPSEADIDAVLAQVDFGTLSKANSQGSRVAPAAWTALPIVASDTYRWEGEAGFIRRPPFVDREAISPLVAQDILGARPLLLLGDDVTTDHISPVSRIDPDSQAGAWLTAQGVAPRDLASFSARRLNHDVMLRGGFANPRLQNALAGGRLGGWTQILPEGRLAPVHEAAEAYRKRSVPLIVVAGARYGAGSARDWAAKVTRLLGVRVVIAESFERIHRTNLIAMGVAPLQIERADRLALDGAETFDILGFPSALRPGGQARLTIHPANGPSRSVSLICRIETEAEVEWLAGGGILPLALAQARTRRAEV